MHPLAIALAVTSAFIHAWRELLTKKAHDKQVFVWLFQVASLVIFLPIPLSFFFTEGISSTVISFGAIAGVIDFYYWLFLSKAYEKGDLSHVYPIIRSSPAFILILSVILFHEQVTVVGVIGVLTILLGVYMINMKRISLWGFLEPLESFRERPTQYALLASLGVTAYSLLDKVAVAEVSPLLYIYMRTIFVVLFFGAYIAWTKRRETIRKEWRENTKNIILNGFFAIVSYVLILIALQFEKVTYVVSIRQLSIVFGVFLGGRLLLEKHRTIRLMASGVMFLGAVLVALG